MKKVLFLLVGLSIALCSCKDETEPNNGGVNNNEGEDTPMVVKKELKSSNVIGVVYDSNGEPLQGVAVETGTISAYTDGNGQFILSQVGVAGGRSVLTFNKEGFFTITRSEELKESTIMEVVLKEKGNSDISVQKEFASNEGAELKAGGMKVEISPNSVVKKDGSVYEGEVNVDMLYLSPNNEDFSSMMPGSDMAAIRTDNSSSILISYGMVEVSLTGESGEKLQLKKGGKSTLTFPIPEGMTNNPPATIPLWSFDDNTGLWVEEGVASLVGNEYVGEVEHFSWHNLDVPSERVTLKGKVVDCEGMPVNGVKVTVEQTYGFTNQNGEYYVYIPENTTVNVTVESKDYFEYSPEVVLVVPGRAGGTTYEQNITLPCAPTLKGKAYNSCGNYSIMSVYAEYWVDGARFQTTPAWAPEEFIIRIPYNAQRAILHFESLGGQKKEIEVNDIGSGIIQLGEINFCDDLDDEQTIFIKQADGTLIPVIADKKDFFITMDDGMLEIMFYDKNKPNETDATMYIYIMDYNGTDESFTGEASYLSSDLMAYGENMSCKVKRNNDEMDITILGNGSIISGTITDADLPMYQISISGTITIPSIQSLTNVNDRSALKGIPNNVANLLPLPIDVMNENFIQGDRLTNFIYENGTQEDMDSIIQELGAIGYTKYELPEFENENGVVLTSGDLLIICLMEPEGLTVSFGPKSILTSFH